MPTMQLSNGCEIYHELHGDAPRTVMMLHGLGGCGLFWTPHVEPIVAAGWRVLIADWPGNGRSGPLAGEFSIDAYVDSFIELAEKTGSFDGPLVICGHSAGGVLAQMFYHRVPDKVAGLVLMQTNTHFMPDALRPLVNLILPVGLPLVYNPVTAAARKAALGLLKTITGPMRDENDPAMVFLEIAIMSTHNAHVIDETKAFANVDIEDCACEITAPVLIVGSVFDPIVPGAHVRALHRCLPGSELRIINRPGHNAALFASEEAGGFLLEFLNELNA